MTSALIKSSSPIISIIIVIIIIILLWYMYYRQVNITYSNEKTQLWANIYNIKEGFQMIGVTIMLLMVVGFSISYMISKEHMTNSKTTINSTDPMVISQTTAGAIKTIHNSIQPVQITQDLIDQLTDAVNNQSDQIASLQQNSVQQ